MTNAATRTQIINLCNTMGYGVGFRGPSDPHLATVCADGGCGEVIVKGRIAHVRHFLELVAA